jgi:predicted phosphodiesterase
MKALIISDLHLLSTSFSQAKYNYLNKLFSSVDEIFINGDLWCVYTEDFADFLKSPWAGLFPLMKSKHTVYVTGNHDSMRYMDSQALLFCDKYVDEYKVKLGQYTYVLKHGHQLLPYHYNMSPDYVALGRKTGEFKFSYFIQKWYLKIFGVDAVKTFVAKQNKSFRKYARTLNADEILVCGHSHWAEFDLPAHFINTGFVDNTYASYLLVEDGEPRLVRERWGV